MDAGGVIAPMGAHVTGTRIMSIWRAVILANLLIVSMHAATLSKATLNAWDEFIQQKELAGKLAPNRPFMLNLDEQDVSAVLRSGAILVAPVEPGTPKRVPSGLIHDWVATAFIPNATIHEVFGTLRDYDHYKYVYHPGVADSRLSMSTGEEDRYSLLLINKSVVAKTALDSEYRTRYFQVSEHRWYSVTESTRIQQIEGYGTAEAHMLPADEGTGLIWRLRSITRYEERGGGVLLQVEAIVLSRDVPSALRWMVNPIVRRVSRQSLELSMQRTRDAVHTNIARAQQPSATEPRRERVRLKNGALSYR